MDQDVHTATQTSTALTQADADLLAGSAFSSALVPHPSSDIDIPMHLVPHELSSDDDEEEAEEENVTRPIALRPLRRRIPSYVDTNPKEFISILNNVKRTSSAAAAAPVHTRQPPAVRKKRRRPLLTELFRPQKDGDLALYEQYVRHSRTFLSNWSKYVDGEGSLTTKLLIVSGPPGTGKTCTIEILAKKFGFRLIELETGPSFARNLINATATARESTGQVPEYLNDPKYTRRGFTRPYYTDESGNVIWDSRPACVHLDCADGLVGADASRFVRDITSAVNSSKRPIIIACNNRFAPAIIDLRQRNFSQEIAFRRPLPTELRKTILRLAELHDISVPRGALENVLETCNGDIRASLTALQFSFVHSVAATQGPATATALLSDKVKPPELDLLFDSDLTRLHDRVFDYSLDTDICWDMKKLMEISDWNAVCDFLHRSNDIDDYIRASLLKYRQLFKSGKTLPLRSATNNYDTVHKVRDTIQKVHRDCNIEFQRSYSKRALLLELLPLVSSMCDTGRATKPATLEKLAKLLYAIGVRSIRKGYQGIFIQPDISVLSEIKLPSEIIPVFEQLTAVNKEITTKKVVHTGAKAKKPHRNWLKPTDTQVEAARSANSIPPGVWLDFKVSDENQAKRVMGLLDLLS